MEKNNSGVYIIIVIFAFLVLAGFYFIFNKLSDVRTDLNNLQLAFQMFSKESKEPAANPPSETPADNAANPPPPSQDKNQGGITIPTAIIFDTLSSPTLQPQTKITVTVEDVTKTNDGTVTANIKVFSGEASSYSALDVRGLFTIINLELEGENQTPVEVTSQFNSIPPKSAVTGTVVFKIEAAKNIIILQVGSGDNVKFYEFNFSKKTYKETVIG